MMSRAIGTAPTTAYPTEGSHAQPKENDSIGLTSYNGLILAYRSVHDEADPRKEATLVIGSETGETLHAFMGYTDIKCGDGGMYYLVNTRNYSYNAYDRVYNFDFEKIAEIDGRYKSFAVTSEGYAVMCGDGEDGKVHFYTVIDDKGDEIYSSPMYDNVISIVGNWAYVLEENRINLRYWNGGFLYTLVEIDDEDLEYLAGGLSREFDIAVYTTGVYHHEPTGWYKNAGTADSPEYIPEEECGIQSGVYINLYYTNPSSDIPGVSADYVFDPATSMNGVFALDVIPMT